MTAEDSRPFHRIQELRIKNFRSLRRVSITLEPLTVLVGPNGSGKSNILASLGFVRRALRLPPSLLRRTLRPSLWRSGDGSLSSTMGIGLRLAVLGAGGEPLEADYAFELDTTAPIARVRRERCVVQGEGMLFFDRAGPTVHHNLGFDVPELQPEALALPLLSRIGPFGLVYDALLDSRPYAIDPTRVRQNDTAEPPFDTELRSNGMNLASVLAYLQTSHPERFERITDHLATVVSGTKVLLRERDQLTYLRFSQDTGAGQVILNAGNMSDGTLRVLGMLTAVYQRPAPFLLAFEEPESTIHPAALPALLDILSVGSETCQLLVTTHSPDVLDWPDLAPDSVKLVEWRDGETSVSPLGQAARSMIDEGRMSLGEMIRSNALLSDPSEPGGEVELFPELM